MALLLLCIVVIFLFCLYTKNKFTYWKRRGIKGPAPIPIVGNFGKVILGKQSINDCYKVFYEKYPNEKLVGLYRGFTPTLLIRDPELIKKIMIKDFPIFQERRITLTNGALSKNLVESEGEAWRLLRKTLTPVFTSSKLKNMMPVIQQCINEYIKYISHIIDNNVDHEITSLKSKFTLRVIETCAFGLDLDTFHEKENMFGKMAKRLLRFPTYSRILIILDLVIPGIFRLLNSNEELFQFFLILVQNVIKQRANEPMQRKDFMDLMIELREQGKICQKKEDGVAELEVDEEMITAQAIIFYAAGFETSSAVMSFMSHELALHQDIQNRLYKEICDVLEKHDNELTYEAVTEMTYLEQIFDETLRMYAVVGFLLREAQSDYLLPGTNITVPKGMLVGFSMMGMNKDEKYFSHPKEFNPDNFLRVNKERIPTCAYMPFGEGPRNCIGMRFAKLQSKMGMAIFIKNFKLEPSFKTKEILDYELGAITLKSRDGIWLKITKR